MNKKIILFGILILVVIIVIIFFYVLRNPCLDGRGVDFYIEKQNIGKLKIKEISTSSSEIIAVSSQNCGKVSYSIKIEGRIKKVNEREFNDFITNYNKDCSNCLIVYKRAMPFVHAIFEVSSGKTICEVNQEWACLTIDLGENKLVCELNPATGKQNLCHCEQHFLKNKVAVIIKDSGIFDKANLTDKIEEYLEAVESDVGVQPVNEKIMRFRGSSRAEFVEFLQDAYDLYNAGYIVIVGDDLPLFKKIPSYCPEGNCEGIIADQTEIDSNGIGEIRKSDDNPEFSCSEQVISYIIPPLEYSQTEKIDFVRDVFDRFIEFHLLSKNIFSRYRNFILAIDYNEAGAPLGSFSDIQPIYPVYETFNTNQKEVRQKFSERPIITAFYVHGLATVQTYGLVDGTIFVYPEDWLNFSNRNPNPTFFISPYACQSFTVGQDNTKECCWPQIYLKTGVFGYGQITKNFFEEPFIGQAYIKNSGWTNQIFGDQFLHFPEGKKKTGTLEGRVFDKNTLQPIDNVAVKVTFGEDNTSWTTQNGNFSLKGVPSGKVTVFIDNPPGGYKRFSEFIVIQEGINNLNIELEK